MLSSIQQYLPHHPWANQIQYFDTIDSTNTRAKQLALQGAPHGTVLIADQQTMGRGRMGRQFISPQGMGIYMSVILRNHVPVEQQMHLTCAVAVAACDALESAVGIRPAIKWTNDLVCGNRKIAGILTELVTTPTETCTIIGIGINCHQQEGDFPEELGGIAGSLTMVTGNAVSRTSITTALLWALLRMDQQLLPRKAQILQHYREDCITIGKSISILRMDTVRHGVAVGIDEDGALLVRFPDGHLETIATGEVSIRGMYGYIS